MKRLNSSGNRVVPKSPRQAYWVHNLAGDLLSGKWKDKGFGKKWITLREGQGIAVLT